MSLFNNSNSSSNPTLNNQVFSTASRTRSSGEQMTIEGTIGKVVMMLSMVLFAACVTWVKVLDSPSLSAGSVWMLGGLLVGLVLAIVMSFKASWAPYLALPYAAAEGLFLGAISAIFHTIFAESMPGIVLTAVSLTFFTAMVLLFCYQARIIKVNEKLRSIIVIATVSVLGFYLITFILSLCGVNISVLLGSSLISIGISVLIVIIAASNLLLDFDFIEKQSKLNAPKYMEWYGAFGLTVTLVWLYLEILKLLGKIAGRN